MHQTLYIDIDEEITSVVERLKKAQASEVVIVVPKRALLIQSIVNLRLLKKEADSFGLQLMIVTQDKLGKLLVEKAGILVQQKLDDALEEEEVGAIPLKGLTNASSGEEKITEDEDVPMLAEKQRISQGGKNRLDTIGSASYFDEKGPALTQEIKIARESITSDSPAEEKIVNKELVTGIGSDIKRKVSFASPTAYPNQKALDMEKPAQPEISRMSISSASGPAGYPSAGTARDNYGQDQKLKDFFLKMRYFLSYS